MKSQVAAGFCPYEIGDDVTFNGIRMIVDDIIFKQSIKNKTAEFFLDLKMFNGAEMILAVPFAEFKNYIRMYPKEQPLTNE